MPLDSGLQNINIDKIFQTKLDTMDRLNKLFSPPEVSVSTEPTSIIPKGMSVEDAMFHPDFEIREEANKLYDQKLKNVSPQYQTGLGQTLTAPMESAKKYINQDLGFDVRSNNEEIYYQQYLKDFHDGIPFNGAFKNAGRFLGRVVVPAATKLVSGFGYIGSMLDPRNMGEGYFAAVADNGLSKWMESLEEDFKNEVLPVYHGLDYDNKGVFAKMADATWWTDSAADGISFLVSAAVPGIAASKLGLLGKAGTLFGTGNKLAKAGNVLGEALTGSSTWGEVGLWAFNTASEAAFEAADVFKQAKQELINQRDLGLNITDSEIDKIAGQKASNTFLGNVAVLSFSNAWEQRNIFKPLMGRGKIPKGKDFGIAEDLAAKSNKSAPIKKWGKVWDWTKFYGKKAGIGIGVEGYWEENAQLAIQRMNTIGDTHNYTNPDDSTLYKFFDQLATQTWKASSWINGGQEDKEVAESIALGGIIGLFGNLSTGILTGGKERKSKYQVSPEETQAMASINNARRNFLSVKDALDEKGNISLDKAKVVADEINKFTNSKLTAESIANPKLRKYTQDLLFGKYVAAVLNADKFGQLEKRLNDLSTKSPQQIAELGLDPTQVLTSNTELLTLAKQVKTKKEEIDQRDISPSKAEDIDYNTDAVIKDRKAMALDYSINAIAALNLKDAHSDTSSKALEEISKLATPVPTEIREINVLNHRIKQLEEIANDESTFEFVKEQKKEQIKEAKEKLKELESKLDISETTKPYKKDKDGYYVSGEKAKDKLIADYAVAEANNRLNNDISSDKTFIATSLLDKEKGTQAHKDILAVLKKMAAKKPSKTELEKKVEKVTTDIAKVSVEKTSDKTTDADFIKELNNSLKDTYISVSLKDGKYAVSARKGSSTSPESTLVETREDVINTILEALKNPGNYKTITVDVKSKYPEIEKMDLSPEEAEKYIAEQEALLLQDGEGMKKEDSIIPFTDSHPPFENRFDMINSAKEEDKEKLERLFRKEHLFNNLVQRKGRFAKEEVKLSAIPVTNLNVEAVSKYFGIPLDFLLEEGYLFDETKTTEENREALVTYIYVEKDGDKFHLINQEGERITESKDIVIGKHVNRDVEKLSSKIRKGADKKKIQKTLDLVTSAFMNIKEFVAFDFQISRGIRNTEYITVETEDGIKISVPKYEPVSPIGNVINEEDIGKTVFIEVSSKSLTKNTGDKIIAGRPYLKTVENNNTGVPVERYEYLDNRLLTEEEKGALNKALSTIIDNFLKSKTLDKNSDEYRYLQGLVLRKGLLGLSQSKTGNLTISIKDKSFTLNDTNIEEFKKTFSDIISSAYHRVDTTLAKETKNTEFKDFVTGKIYKSYQHYLLNNVLTIRLKDQTKNKPDAEPSLARIQRYAIIDLSPIKSIGVSKEDIINVVPLKEDKPAQEKRQQRKAGDIVLKYSEKKESPVDEPSKKKGGMLTKMVHGEEEKAEKEVKKEKKTEPKKKDGMLTKMVHGENRDKKLQEETDKLSKPRKKGGFLTSMVYGESETTEEIPKTEPKKKDGMLTKMVHGKEDEVVGREPKEPESKSIFADKSTEIEPIAEEENRTINPELRKESENLFNQDSSSLPPSTEEFKLDDSNWGDEEVSQEEVDEVLRILDQVELNESDKDRLFKGRTVYGSTRWANAKRAIITIYRSAKSGTAFHEAFEVVYNFILSHEQQQYLINKFKNREGSFTTFNGQIKKYSQASAKEAKEQMADEYALYKKGIDIPKEAPVGFFQRLWNFVRKFISKIIYGDIFRENALYSQEDVFSMMDRGSFRGIELRNDTNEYFSMQVGANLINPIDTEQFLRSANYIMFTILGRKNTNLLTALEEGGNLNLRIYDELRKELVDFYNNKGGLLLKSRDVRIKQLSELLGIDTESARQQVLEEFILARQYISDITSTEEGWREFVRQHKNYLSRFGVDIIDDTEPNEEKEGTKTNEYNNDKLKFDNFRSTPASIKLLISSLQERVYDGTPNGAPVINPITLIPHSISEAQYVLTFNRVMNLLAGSSSIEDIKYKLDSVLAKEINFSTEENPIDFGFYSIIKQLRQKIFLKDDASEIDYNSLDKYQMKNILRFVGAFAKQKPLFLRAKFDEDDNIYFANADYESQVAYSRRNFYHELANRVYRKKPLDTSYLKKSGNDKLLIKDKIPTIPSIGLDFRSNLEEFSKALNLLGFNYFTPQRIENIHVNERKILHEEATFISTILKEMAEKNTKIPSISAKGLGINGRINRISEIIAIYTADDTTPMLFNSEGEAQSKYVDHNAISLVVSDMEYIAAIYNKPEQIEERKFHFLQKNPQYNHPYFRNSVIFNRFFEKGIVPKVTILSGLDAYGISQGRGASSLSHEELYMVRLALGFSQRGRTAVYPIFENADGNIDWEIQPGDQYVNSSDFSRGNFLETALKGYLLDEVTAAIDFKNSELKGKKQNLLNKISLKSRDGVVIPKRQAGLSLGFSAAYLDAETILRINEYIDNDAREDLGEFISSIDVKSNFIEYTLAKSKENLSFIKNRSLYDKKIERIRFIPDEIYEEFEGLVGEQKSLRLLQVKVANDFFSSVENSKLIFGKIQNFKSIEDALKRFKSFLSPRLTLLQTEELDNWMNKNMNETQDESNLTYHVHKAITSYYSIDDIQTINEGLSQIANKFENNEAVDGESYGLASFIRELKFKSGAKWSERKENMYQVHQAYERFALDKKEIQPYKSESLREKDLKLLEPYNLNGKYVLNLIDLEEVEGENILKPILSGLDQNGETSLVKTSIVPLTYYLVEGTHMEGIYLDMRKNKADMLTYLSSHKTGQEVNETGSIGNIIKEDGSLNNPSDVASLEQISKRNTSIQVETEGEKDATTGGTQIMKIVTTDMYDEGIPSDYIVADRISKWFQLSEEEKLKESTLYTLEREHDNALRELFLHNYYDFLEKIGVEESIVNRNITYISKDSKKVRDKIEEYVTKHGVPKNIIEQLEYDETGKHISYELMSDYSLIKSIIYSMIDKGMASLKLNGGQKIQFAGVFFDKKEELPNYNLRWRNTKTNETISNSAFKNLSREEADIYKPIITNTTLKFYERGQDGHPTSRMQVMISSRYLRDTNKRREQLGLSILSEQEFLELLKTESPKLLEGIGFRIPTQAVNSIDAFEIVGFLPDFMGDAIAVPSELPTKAGSDFDVDKLTTYLNNMYVDNKGVPRYITFETNSLKLYKRRYEKYETLLNRVNTLLDKKYQKEVLVEENKSIDDLFSNIGLETTRDFWSDEEINEILQEEGITKLTIDQLEELAKNERETRPSYPEFKALPLYRQNSKKAVENRYFQSIADIVLHPSTFERLIRPNDASKLKDTASYAAKLKGQESSEKVFDVSKLTDSLYLTLQRALFQAGKKLVGIGAVGVTSHSNFQKITSVVTQTKKELDEGGFIEYGKFVFPHNKIGDLATLSGRITKDGDNIAEIGGAFVDGTVDIVKDPWLLRLGAYGVTYGPAVMANKIGYSRKNIALVINNPLVQEYQRLKNYSKSPAKQLGEDKYNKTPYTIEEWLNYFTEELGIDTNVYYRKRNYANFSSEQTSLLEKSIEISHHNIGNDPSKGSFDFEFLKEYTKNLPENTDMRWAMMKAFEDFLNLEKIATEARVITNSSNHETAHIKDNSSTLSKESNIEFARKASIKALVGFGEDGSLILSNAGRAIREKLFIGTIADKIVNFENKYVYKELLLPQTQHLAKWIVSELSKEEEFEVFEGRVGEMVADMEKTVMSAFLYDSIFPTTRLSVKHAIKEIVSYSSDIRIALEKAISLANSKKYDSDKFSKGLNVLELLEIVQEDIEDPNNDYYYIKVKKRPTAKDVLASSNIYDGLKNLKRNKQKIAGTDYTYSDLYTVIMLHSIYRNGTGFSKNSLQSFMSPEEYRDISQGILSMDISPEVLKRQQIVMIQNKPALLGESYTYLKGPIIRIPITNGELEIAKNGTPKIITMPKDTSTYKINTGKQVEDQLEFTDLILIPEKASYSQKTQDEKGKKKKEKVESDNHQAKKEFIYYKVGSKSKGTNAEVLLHKTGIKVSVGGKMYFVYQHFPIKGSKYSREYGSIKSQEDWQSLLRDENVPVYSQFQIESWLNSIEAVKTEHTDESKEISLSNPPILVQVEDVDIQPSSTKVTHVAKESSLPTTEQALQTFGFSAAEYIYSQLGDETAPEGSRVIIDEVNGRKPMTESKGIVAYRTRRNNFLEALEKDNAIGNPWSHAGYSLYKTNTVKEAVEEFIAWMIGEKHSDKLQDYREAIIDRIPKLKGKDILYYKDLEEPSHATALDYLINEYNWGNQSNIEEIKEQPIEQQKKTPIKKGSFEYKGKTIETEFELTNSQNEALKKLIDFSLQDEKRAITLQGPAGTGKTSTIGNLQNYLKEMGYTVVYMAPTHAATAELAFATVKYGNRDLPLTVQSSFQRRFDPQIGQETFNVTSKLKQRLGLSNNIIVVDETSMLNSKDYEIIKKVIESQGGMIKVIFMGDPMQIPEVDVKNPTEKNVSKAFTELDQVELTEIKRTSDMSILNILTKLRDYLSSFIPRIANTPKLKYLIESEFNKELINKFKSDPENTVLISYTNKSVQAYNNQIRKILGRTGDLQKGDLIVGFLGYQSKQIEKGNIANSVRYTVDNVTKSGSEYVITASSSKLKQLEELNMRGVKEKATTSYLQLSNQDSLIFEDLTAEDFRKNNEKVSNLFRQLYYAKTEALKNPRLWSDYYMVQKMVSKAFESIDLGNDYVYNPSTNSMELYNNITHGKLLKDFSELKVEKGIDFGHAITVHKSQGQTIKNVFFNSSSLPKGDSSKIMMNGEQISSEKQSLIYVGLSRASENLYILDSGNNIFWDFENNKPYGKDASPSNTTSTDVEDIEFEEELNIEDEPFIGGSTVDISWEYYQSILKENGLESDVTEEDFNELPPDEAQHLIEQAKNCNF